MKLSPYQRIFLKQHGNFPHECHWCGDEVAQFGRTSEDANVHHIDHDRSNDDSANLVIGHVRCHLSYHLRQEWNRAPKSDEHKAKIAATLRGRKLDDDHRAAISVGMMGHAVTDEGRSNMSAAAKRRDPKVVAESIERLRAANTGRPLSDETKQKLSQKSPCPDCGVSYSLSWLKRHVANGKCVVASTAGRRA